MTESKDYHPSEEELREAWNEGYRQGYDMGEKFNDYEVFGDLWEEYEKGYEEGWLDS